MKQQSEPQTTNNGKNEARGLVQPANQPTSCEKRGKTKQRLGCRCCMSWHVAAQALPSAPVKFTTNNQTNNQNNKVSSERQTNKNKQQQQNTHTKKKKKKKHQSTISKQASSSHRFLYLLRSGGRGAGGPSQGHNTCHDSTGRKSGRKVSREGGWKVDDDDARSKRSKQKK